MKTTLYNKYKNNNLIGYYKKSHFDKLERLQSFFEDKNLKLEWYFVEDFSTVQGLIKANEDIDSFTFTITRSAIYNFKYKDIKKFITDELTKFYSQKIDNLNKEQQVLIRFISNSSFLLKRMQWKKLD